MSDRDHDATKEFLWRYPALRKAYGRDPVTRAIVDQGLWSGIKDEKILEGLAAVKEEQYTEATNKLIASIKAIQPMGPLTAIKSDAEDIKEAFRRYMRPLTKDAEERARAQERASKGSAVFIRIEVTTREFETIRDWGQSQAEPMEPYDVLRAGFEVLSGQRLEGGQ